MPPRIYAKHLVQQGSEYTTKRDIHTYANLKVQVQVITRYDKILHITCIFYHNQVQK